MSDLPKIRLFACDRCTATITVEVYERTAAVALAREEGWQIGDDLSALCPRHAVTPQ